VQRYGTFILLRPPFEPLTILLWGSPVIALLAGGAIVLLALRQRRRTASAQTAPLSAAERARLDELLRS
jgi:cytochrome c-type biogenesis protein CcmH